MSIHNIYVGMYLKSITGLPTESLIPTYGIRSVRSRCASYTRNNVTYCFEDNIIMILYYTIDLHTSITYYNIDTRAEQVFLQRLSVKKIIPEFLPPLKTIHIYL